jgi:predicted AlkP superfamily pyrophosphatase or phosphodiesterase
LGVHLRRALAAALAAAAILLCALATRAGAAVTPILVLVSVDGFRWDYSSRYPTPNLRALASRGVRAKALIPSFPSLTFPNHYTMATGLYPEHHGIVANTFEEPGNPVRFSMSRQDAVRDAHWWGGEPIWVTAERQGRRAAAMFWPGTEAAIRGIRPTYWRPFDGKLPAASRTAQVLEWLALPEDTRPSFVTLYYDDVDHAGHDFGPDAPETGTAVARVDREIGALSAGIRRLGLGQRTTIVVVSDHGMAPVSRSRFILLDDYIDIGRVAVLDSGGFLSVAPRNGGDTAAIAARLGDAHPHLRIYTRETIPARLHYSANPRIAPIVGVADVQWLVTTIAARQRRQDEGHQPPAGAHGYDPAETLMHAVFVAAGPDIAPGVVIEPFSNVDVYDIACAVLGLTPAANDGDPGRASAWLRHSR